MQAEVRVLRRGLEDVAAAQEAALADVKAQTDASDEATKAHMARAEGLSTEVDRLAADNAALQALAAERGAAGGAADSQARHCTSHPGPYLCLRSSSIML